MKYYSFTINVDEEDPISIRDRLIEPSQKRVIFDSDRLICEDQLKVAIHRADRAFTLNKNVANNWGIEVLLHLAADHQIKNAIDLLGIQSDTKHIGIVQENPGPILDNMVPGLTLSQPTESLIRDYNIDHDNPCLDIISKGVSIIIDHE